MKLKNAVCCVALLFSSICAHYARGGCTGWGSTCGYTPTPPAPGSMNCCKSPGYGAPSQYVSTGTGAKLYSQGTDQCGHTAKVVERENGLVCDAVTSHYDCGGTTAVVPCTGS